MILSLAPMEGITGHVFRRVHADCFGALDRYYTPFIAPPRVGCAFKGKAARELDPVAWRGIAGYSLAGLFALWSLWETPAFSRMASVSGSLWFPGLLDWCTGRPLAASPDVAYLSLGKREHKTPNRMMRGVLDATRGFEALLRERGVETTLELNPGNHFCEPDARTARGIAWLLRA